MKNTVTILFSLFCILTGAAQSNSTGGRTHIPAKTPELEALYRQAHVLENQGTAAEINANRLAIKNAWQQVAPEVAALYKPLPPVTETLVWSRNEITQEESQAARPMAPTWGTDLLVRSGFIDYLDMDVTSSGDIYLVAVENYSGSSGVDSDIYIYRSQDDGESFTLWDSLHITDSFFSKIQVISFDGTGDDYLLVYSLFENGTFQALRWNMADATFAFEGVASGDITDFSVDRNFPLDTSGSRVFATYVRDEGGPAPQMFAARSMAGSYGFDWVDEFDFGWYTSQTSFAYGLNGGCYTAFVGGVDPVFYATMNPNYNDPASWVSPYEELTDSGVTEVLNPTIRATRKEVASDEVIILVGARPAGSSDHYEAKAFRRENGAPYASINYISVAADQNQMQMDTWIKRDLSLERIQTSYVRERIDGSADNVNRSAMYDGSGFPDYEPVSDSGTSVFAHYPSAIAELANGEACMAFAGTDGFGEPFDLYFDKKSETIGISENELDAFTFYPNPVRSVLHLSSKKSIDRVSVYNLMGQKVMQRMPMEINPSIDFSSLASGMYVMEVEVDGHTVSRKIIKE